MGGFLRAQAVQFWQVVDAPIHWINGGPLDRELQLALECLELLFVGLIIFSIIMATYGLIRRKAYEREIRRRQGHWRNPLQERKRRIVVRQMWHGREGFGS